MIEMLPRYMFVIEMYDPINKYLNHGYEWVVMCKSPLVRTKDELRVRLEHAIAQLAFHKFTIIQYFCYDEAKDEYFDKWIHPITR